MKFHAKPGHPDHAPPPVGHRWQVLFDGAVLEEEIAWADEERGLLGLMRRDLLMPGMDEIPADMMIGDVKIEAVPV